MDVSGMVDFAWNTVLINIVPFLFVLTVIVFFHELGHYLVGRWCGIGIETFSVGFGKELAGFTDRHGTRWKLSAIPLGGYVKFLGDSNAASMPDNSSLQGLSAEELEGTFQSKSVWRRAATVAAGPIANFILAIAIFAGVAYFNGRVVADPVIAQVQENSPAQEAGLQPGDKIVSADGNAITYFSDFQRHVASRADVPIALSVERAGQLLQLEVTPRERVQQDAFGNEFKVPVVGIVATNDSSAFRVEHLSLTQSVAYGAAQTWFITERTADFLVGLVRGAQPADQLSGPIGIAHMSGQAASLGFATLLNMAALLSVSIGLLNLMPIPILDGGHLVFYAIEAIRGKPVSERVMEVSFRIGFALLIGLMVFASSNDILSRIGGIW